MIVLGYARPFVLERVLQKRNVQRQEAQRMGEAWGNVNAVVGWRPRMFRKGVMMDMLQPAVPELFEKKCPVDGVWQFQLKDHKSPHYLDEKTLREALEIEELEGLDKEKLNVLVRAPSRPIWDHEGVCSCGKRAYLFSQCFKCLAADNQEAEFERADAELEEDFYVPTEEERDTELESGRALASG